MTTSTERVVRNFTLTTLVLTAPLLSAQEGDESGEETQAANANNEIVERLEREKKELELRADIEEARKRAAEAEAARIGARAGETEALEGSVTLNSGAGYFAEILAYEALRQVAADIASGALNHLEGDSRKIIVIGDADLSTDIALWELTFAQIERLAERQEAFLAKYATNEQDPSAFTIPGATALITSVADLVGYFREDTELSQYAVKMDDPALQAQVVAAIRVLDPGKKVIIPARNLDVDGQLFKRLAHVVEQRNKLLERNRAIQGTDSESDYAKQAKGEIESVAGAVATLLEKLTTPPEQSAVAPLQTLSYVDKLKIYPDDIFLSIAIAGQGGEVQVTKSIWTGGRISYIGGAVGTYYLTTATGEVIAAGTTSSYQKAAYGQRRGVTGLKVK